MWRFLQEAQAKLVVERHEIRSALQRIPFGTTREHPLLSVYKDCDKLQPTDAVTLVDDSIAVVTQHDWFRRLIYVCTIYLFYVFCNIAVAFFV